MGYASLSELKQFLGIGDAADDVNLTLALNAAQSHIDRLANRTFGQTVETRSFTATDPHTLAVPDLVSVTAVATDGTTWATTDYQLQRSGFVRPYSRIAAVGGRHFAGTVQVSGTWGWPTVPDDVKFAALILASRLFKRKDSPEGILGFNDFGSVRLSPQDRDVVALLTPYRRRVVA